LETLPVILARGGLLRTDRIAPETFCQAFGRLSQRSCRRHCETTSVLIAAVVTLGISRAISDRGLYPLLDAGASVARFHFEEWWAKPNNGVVGFIAFSIVITFFGYITARHTLMGIHILGWLAQMRATARAAGSKEWFGYSDVWTAPEEALGELRGATLDVFTAILLGASAAACAVYALALPPLLVIILTAYLVYNLHVFVVPWVYLNRQLRRSKRRLQADLVREIGASSGQRADLEMLTLGYQRLADLPERVIERFPVGALVALTSFPSPR